MKSQERKGSLTNEDRLDCLGPKASYCVCMLNSLWWNRMIKGTEQAMALATFQMWCAGWPVSGSSVPGWRWFRVESGPSWSDTSESLPAWSTPTRFSHPRKLRGSCQHWFSTYSQLWGNDYQLWPLQYRIRAKGELLRDHFENSIDITHQPIFYPLFAGDRGGNGP